MSGLICILAISSYIYGQLKNQNWTQTLDKLFFRVSTVPQLHSLVQRLNNTLDKFLEDIMSFIIDLAVWDDDGEQLIEAKAVAVVTRLRQEAEELKTKHDVWKQIMEEDLEANLAQFRKSRDAEIANELADFKTRLGAHELVIGNSVSISDLQNLWASEYPLNTTPKSQNITAQQERVLAYLVDSLLAKAADRTIECAGGEKVQVNSLAFSLLSPVFAAIPYGDFQILEISGRRLATLSQLLTTRKCQVGISDLIASLNVADYLAMDAVLGVVLEASDEASKSDTLRGALAIAELNLSNLDASKRWNLGISGLSKEAMACFTDSTFTQLIGDRKFFRKTDLEALLRYKEWSEEFGFFEFLATDDLDASVLAECERLLNADAYASLLTAVLANIEKENARLSRLQSIKESPSDTPAPQPVRSFRYSVN